MVMKASLTTARVLRMIADEKSMDLFRTIFQTGGGIDSEDLQDKTKLTRKEYYTRLSGMVKAGLVMKTDGRYTLTAFGNVVHCSQMMVENGIANFWKLKAIDSLSMSKELPKEEQQKVTDKLLKDQEIKEIIVIIFDRLNLVCWFDRWQVKDSNSTSGLMALCPKWRIASLSTDLLGFYSLQNYSIKQQSSYFSTNAMRA
jgi:hypothetical protein